MGQTIRVGILGAGWPGMKHAEGYRDAGGFEVAAVADLIPARRKAILQVFPKASEFGQAEELLEKAQVDAVSVCLPNHLHASLVIAALKRGKHVVCETPPALSAGEVKKVQAAAEKSGKTLLFAAQRRFGGAEQAVAQAIAKRYIGEAYHVRASWMRTRGIPAGTGWYTDRSKSGGGVMLDLGAPMLDLSWQLLGQPRPLTAFSVVHSRFRELVARENTFDVEDAAFAIVKFEGGKTVELSSSWAMNQPPRQQGTSCRVHGDKGAIEVYVQGGPVLYRNFSPKGEFKESPLKLPKLVQYAAMMRHFRAAINDGARASPSGSDALVLMQMMDALYKSAESGKSCEIRANGARRDVHQIKEGAENDAL
jgi:predicted dehydrogenase